MRAGEGAERIARSDQREAERERHLKHTVALLGRASVQYDAAAADEHHPRRSAPLDQ